MSLARCGFETAAVWLRRSISECVDRQIKLMPDESFINVMGILSFWEYSGRQAGRTPAGGEVVWLLVRLGEEWVSGWMDGWVDVQRRRRLQQLRE